MTEHHRVYGGGFVVMHNDAVNDSRLSFKARGLLAYMLARPPQWRFNAKRIADAGPDGRDAVLSGLRELQAAGYYRARRVRDRQTGLFRMVTEVAPLPGLLPALDAPGTGYPTPDDPGPGEPGPGEAGPYVSTESHHGEPRGVK